MVFRYVLKNFSRRKVRTFLMIISLIVSTGLIVTMSATVATLRQSNVDLVVSELGRADVTISKKDTSLNPYIAVAEVSKRVQSADARITAVHPRTELGVEFIADGRTFYNTTTLIGLNFQTDDIGSVIVKDGDYVLGDNQVAVYENLARDFGIAVGDQMTLEYIIPRPREEGQAANSSVSQRRLQHTFTVSSIVVQDGISSSNDAIIADLGDVQAWLARPNEARQLLVTVDAALYENSNADVSALQMRDITVNIQRALSDEYRFSLAKASTLSELRVVFQAAQALINTYGLISLGVVGLLVHTLVMTNVQEQRRDMAVLRILGGQRPLLFRIVIIEVIVIGLIGVGLGVVLGQVLTTYVVVPLLIQQASADGVTVNLTPAVSVSAVLPAILSAFAVLIISAIKPARDAAKTKVMHAINPGVADNIQLEDLTQLRERKPNFRLFLIGLALMVIFLMIISSELISAFGLIQVEVILALVWLVLLVLGVSFMFFITTIPFERLTIAIMGLMFPRLTYFAGRNVSRGQTRNTLIAMLVLFSGVLPSFLATQTRMDNANFENNAKSRLGAPVRIETYQAFFDEGEFSNSNYMRPSFVREQLATVPGFDSLTAISYEYSSRVRDAVGLRSAAVGVIGVEGDLQQTTFSDMLTFAEGGPESLRALLTEPNAVVISEGLASYLALSIGDEIELQGQGLDNQRKVRIVGVARHIPGIRNMGRSRVTAQNYSSVLVSMPTFRQLITELNKPLPDVDAPLMNAAFATLEASAEPNAVSEELFNRFETTQPIFTQFLELQLEWNRSDQAIQQSFLLVLTGISFTTAVFGVFAVIYVTIFARRLEIGMLKAIGMRRRELTLMLILESIAMTLGSALAGIAAGAFMGYVSFYSQNVASQIPVTFAVDTLVMPAIIILVVVASILGATFSSRRIVRKRAIEILRL